MTAPHSPGDDVIVHRTKLKRASKRQSSLESIERTANEAFLDKARALARAYEEDKAPSAWSMGMLLWVLFGASGWWSCNAIFAELPLFVAELPAAERLGSQLSMMTQLGNVFLIAYKVLDCYYSFNVGKLIYMMMGLAVTALVACALLWDVAISGQSIPLMVLMVLAGGVGCMSEATYWAFMISYPAACTKAVSVGMSMSGVLTAGIVALQLGGSNNGPRFTACTFFAVAAVAQLMWWIVVCIQQGQLWSSCRWMHAEPGPKSERLLDKCSVKDPEDLTSVQEPASPPASPPAAKGLATSARPSRTVVAFGCCSYLLHGATYTVPSLLPLLARAYPEFNMERELLVWMLALQQGGGTLGRIFAPHEKQRLLPALAAACLIFCFASFLVGALCPRLLASTMSYPAAALLLPFMCLAFYFSYGVLSTWLFLCSRSLVEDKAAAEHIASNMGFLGQMGSLSANLVAFCALNFA